MKILVVLPSFDLGGSEIYCFRLIRFASMHGLEWHVTSGNAKNSQMEPMFHQIGVETHASSPGYLSIRSARRFLGFLKTGDFDVLMTFNGAFAAPSLSLAKLAGIPKRIAWHRRSTPAFAPTIGRRLYLASALRVFEYASTHLLSNSRAAFDRFHGSTWESDRKYKVIPNGIDGCRFRPRLIDSRCLRKELALPESATVVGHVGRFDPAKNHETLFKIVRKARDSGMDAWLLCAGTGTDTDAFKERLKIHGITEVTRALGPRTDIERLHHALDVFVFPSLTEGQPNALIEAILSGIRVLASDIAPVREAVPVALYGNLFPPQDAEGAVALLKTRGEGSAEQRENARQWAVERYDPVRNFTAVLEVMGC